MLSFQQAINTANSFSSGDLLNTTNPSQPGQVAAPPPDVGGDTIDTGGDSSRWYQKNIRDKILQPSLTAHFLVHITEPTSKKGAGDWSSFKAENNITTTGQEKLMLLCSETVLPGSSLATHTITSDRTGVTEKHAYRRTFDERIDLTFMVNGGEDAYLPIRFFEAWMKYISVESTEVALPYYAYRMRYPEEYYGGLNITKFERSDDAELRYNFLNVFPISVVSMPVSYDASQMMKCTVSFSYVRYWIDSLPGQKNPPSSKAQDYTTPPPASVPKPVTPKSDTKKSWADGRQPGDYKVRNTSRGPRYKKWDGKKWGSETNVKPKSGRDVNKAGEGHFTISDKHRKTTKKKKPIKTTTTSSGRPAGAHGGGSDIRIKENIIKISQSPSGLNIYEWNYKSAPNSRYRGVMAQEVMKVVPEAVYAEEDGFLSVYYDMIDVNMELVR